MEENISPSGFIDIAIRKRRVIASIIFSALTATLMFSLLVPESYEARVTFYMPIYHAHQVQMTGPTEQLTKTGFPLPSATGPMVRGVIRVLSSRTVAERVALDVPERDPATIHANSIVDVSKEGIFVVRVQDKESGVASRIANAYPAAASEYLEMTTNIGSGAHSLQEFIEHYMSQVQLRMDAVEAALTSFLHENESVSVSDEMRKLMDMEANWRTQKLITQVALLENDERKRVLSDQMNLAGQDIIENQLGSSTSIQRLRQRAADLEIRIERLRQTYTDYHPEILSLRAALQELQTLLMNEVRTTVNSHSEPLNPIVDTLKDRYIDAEVRRSILTAKSDVIESSIDGLTDRFQDLTGLQLEYVKLEREWLTLNRIFNALSLKLEEARFQEQQEGARFVILERAEFRGKPSYPSIVVNLIIFLSLSLLLCIFMFLYWKDRDAKRRAVEAEKYEAEDLRGVFQS